MLSRLNVTTDLVALGVTQCAAPSSLLGGEKNADAAKRAANEIRDGVKVLMHQPDVGRSVENMEPEYREWIIRFGVSGYIVLYHYDGETAVILAVRHQREVGY